MTSGAGVLRGPRPCDTSRRRDRPSGGDLARDLRERSPVFRRPYQLTLSDRERALVVIPPASRTRSTPRTLPRWSSSAPRTNTIPADDIKCRWQGRCAIRSRRSRSIGADDEPARARTRRRDRGAMRVPAEQMALSAACPRRLRPLGTQHPARPRHRSAGPRSPSHPSAEARQRQPCWLARTRGRPGHPRASRRRHRRHPGERTMSPRSSSVARWRHTDCRRNRSRPVPEDAERALALTGDRLFVMDKWRYHPGIEALGVLARSGESNT